MQNQDFENIRPFTDSEACKAANELTDAKDFTKLLTPLVGSENAKELADGMKELIAFKTFKMTLRFLF